MEAMSLSLRDAEQRAVQASKATDGLESQLSETSAALEEETRQKLAMNSKLRALEQEKEHMYEQLEEEESRAKMLEKQLTTASQQLTDARKKSSWRRRRAEQRCWRNN